MKLGYAHVSTLEQSLENQIANLKSAKGSDMLIVFKIKDIYECI